jgi:hypothetical protein
MSPRSSAAVQARFHGNTSIEQAMPDLPNAGIPAGCLCMLHNSNIANAATHDKFNNITGFADFQVATLRQVLRLY